MSQRHIGRRLLLMSVLGAAMVAITCHSHVYFSLLTVGTTEIAAGDQPPGLALAQLANINLAALPAMQTQGLDLGDLSTAKPLTATVAVTTPATGGDLTFLQRLDAVLTADGMAPLLVATGSSFAAQANLVQLLVQPVEAIGYFKGKNPTVTLVPTYVAAAPAALTLTLDLALQVHVGQPSGSCTP